MKSLVDHIAILVDDLDTAEEWYTKNLIAEVEFRDEYYIRLRLANTTLALIDKNKYPHAHVGILVENYCDLPSNLGEVVHHRDGTSGVYAKDPFGNYLEYIWYSEDQKKVFVKDD